MIRLVVMVVMMMAAAAVATPVPSKKELHSAETQNSDTFALSSGIMGEIMDFEQLKELEDQILSSGTL